LIKATIDMKITIKISKYLIFFILKNRGSVFVARPLCLLVPNVF
jgi:hypothetical protein